MQAHNDILPRGSNLLIAGPRFDPEIPMMGDEVCRWAFDRIVFLVVFFLLEST